MFRGQSPAWLHLAQGEETSSGILECAEQTATTNQADLLESVPESAEATTTMSPGARGLMKLQPALIRGLALSSGKTVSFWAGLSIQLSQAGRVTSPLCSPTFAHLEKHSTYLCVLHH